MYKIPPSYYIKQMLKADNPGQALSAWLAMCKHVNLQVASMATSYAEGYRKLWTKVLFGETK